MRIALLGWLWVTTAMASDVGVIGRSAVFQSNTTTSTQKAKSLQRDPNIHLGAAATPAQLSGQFEVYFVDTPTNKGVLPVPAPWAVVSPAVAKFKNSLAPAGPTPVKSVSIKAGKIAKVSASGLGGAEGLSTFGGELL